VSFLLRYTNDNKSNNKDNDNNSSSSNNNDLLKMTDAVVHQGNGDRLPTQNVQEVLSRFKKQRYFTLNSKQKQFNSDTFARIQKEHVSANKIDDFFVHTGNARAAAAIRQREGNGNVVVQAVAQFKDCSYFVDTGDKRVFCVHTEEAKQGFLARGFTPLQVTFFFWHTNYISNALSCGEPNCGIYRHSFKRRPSGTHAAGKWYIARDVEDW
jgi:hypothetical protein